MVVSSGKRKERQRRLEALSQERTEVCTLLRSKEAALQDEMKLVREMRSGLNQMRSDLHRQRIMKLDVLSDRYYASLAGAETSLHREHLKELDTLISALEADIPKCEADISKCQAVLISKLEADISVLKSDVADLNVQILATEAEAETVNEADYFTLIRKLGAPSSLQKARNWRKAQEVPVYLCHCPPTAEPPLPLTLVHPAFATFVDRFNNTSTVEFGDVECQLAFDLCSLVAEHYSRETSKMEDINRLFGKYLGLAINPITILGYPTDGSHVQGTHLIYTSEGKKEEENPLFQGIHYYGLFLSTMEQSLRASTVCPCFLVELVGVHVRISGLAYLNKVACQPFTTFMHCYTNIYDRTDMDCLCRAFWALRQGISELKQFYGSTPPRVDKRIPYPLQAKPVRFVERIGTKLLFVVELEQSKNLMLVKYCKRYGDTVHATWAGKGLAPKLYESEKIAGGWVAIEMEYLSPPDWKTVHEWAKHLDETKKSELRSAVHNALREAHTCTCEGMEVAHGDMRAPNIMARSVEDSFEIKFLDFDWAGAVPSTIYPSFINTDLCWHKDVGTGRPLQQDHDWWWADKWTEVGTSLDLPLQLHHAHLAYPHA